MENEGNIKSSFFTRWFSKKKHSVDASNDSTDSISKENDKNATMKANEEKKENRERLKEYKFDETLDNETLESLEIPIHELPYFQRSSYFNSEKEYKRKGFFSALENRNSNGGLLDIIKEQEVNTEFRKERLNQILVDKLAVIQSEFDSLNHIMDEKKNIKAEFEKGMEKMKEELDELISEVKKHYEDLGGVIKELGKAKEGMVDKRLDDFKREMEKMVDIYHEIEKKQNDKLSSDFEKKVKDEKERKFYGQLRDDLNSDYLDVNKRIQALNNSGLNLFVARFLISIGWVAAFVSGCFFSIWRTPLSEKQDKSNFSILLDAVGNYTKQFDWGIIILSIFVFMILIYMISLFCYKQLIKYEFILPPDLSKKKNASHKEEDDDDKIEFNIDDEKMLKFKFKANNWFAFVLKIIPIMLFFFILIVIVKKSNSVSPVTDFKDIGGSVAIQFLGTLIPVTFTGIYFMYIIKVIESRFIEMENNGSTKVKSKKYLNWEIIFGLILFTILAILMIVNVSPLKSLFTFNQFGVVGFFVSCLSTAICLGYGYRYTALVSNLDVLFWKTRFINIFIEKISNPYRFYYLRRKEIIRKMEILNHSVIDLFQSKNELAASLLNQNKVTGKQGNSFIDNNSEISNSELHEDVGKRIAHLFHNLFKKAKIHNSEILNNIVKAKLKEGEPLTINENITEEDKVFFPELYSKIVELKIFIEEKNKQVTELNNELNGYFRNEYTYASLNDQIKLIEKQKNVLKQKEDKIKKDVLNIIINFDTELSKIKVLIQEGYYLGKWFGNNSPQ